MKILIKERLFKLEQKINVLMNNHLTHMDSRIRRNEYLLYTILFFLLGISWKLMWSLHTIDGGTSHIYTSISSYVSQWNFLVRHSLGQILHSTGSCCRSFVCWPQIHSDVCQCTCHDLSCWVVCDCTWSILVLRLFVRSFSMLGILFDKALKIWEYPAYLGSITTSYGYLLKDRLRRSKKDLRLFYFFAFGHKSTFSKI